MPPQDLQVHRQGVVQELCELVGGIANLRRAISVGVGKYDCSSEQSLSSPSMMMMMMMMMMEKG